LLLLLTRVQSAPLPERGPKNKPKKKKKKKVFTRPQNANKKQQQQQRKQDSRPGTPPRSNPKIERVAASKVLRKRGQGWLFGCDTSSSQTRPATATTKEGRKEGRGKK
jgi:hypothetical protein